MKAFPMTLMATLVAALALLNSCSTVPVTGRKQLNMVSDSKIVQMAIADFELLKSKAPISSHPVFNEMLQNVGNRISQQVFSDQPLAEWEFIVIEDQRINAFAMPGGKVAIFTGLFQIVKTEEELAAVVAHEIAHVTARHSHEQQSQAMLAQTGGNILGIATSVTGAGIVGLGGSGSYINITDSIMGVYGMGAEGAIMKSDRRKESEADHIGIFYMARAGYNPQAAITVMERMAELENGMPQANYGSSHPSSIERLNELHGVLEEAMAEYEMAKEFQF